MEDTRILPLRDQDISSIKAWLHELIGKTVYRLDRDLMGLVPIKVDSCYIIFESSSDKSKNITLELSIQVFSQSKSYVLNEEVFLSKEDAVNYVSNKLLNK